MIAGLRPQNRQNLSVWNAVCKGATICAAGVEPNVRAIAIALFAACVAQSFGQLVDAEKYVEAGAYTLRLQKEIMLSLDGIDQIGARKTTLFSNAFFSWDPDLPNSFAKAEINDYVDGAHTNRLVADGTILWSYSYPRNTYSTFRYGSYSGAEPQGFRSNMLQEMTAASTASTVFLARALRETFAGVDAQYTTWFPGAAITLVDSGVAMTDPVDPDRKYVGDDLNVYVVYTYTPRQKRSAAFHMTRPDLAHPWMLSEIYYADLRQLNPSTPRFLEWLITVHTGKLPLTTNYVFVPPTTARGIANVKGGG